MIDELPECAEHDADPHTAAIYGELRHLGGTPMVALIFRHLATLPGALPWAWDAIGPAWRSGALQESAWALAARAPIEPIAPIPREALAVLGTDADALLRIRDVLRAFNRANPVNLLSVLCLSRLVDGARATRVLPAGAWRPPPSIAPLGPMPDPAALPPDLGRLLDRVADPGEPGRPRLVQSLYRHLLRHPGAFALFVTLLQQRLQDGSIARSAAALQAGMGTAADELVPAMSAPAAPHPGVRPALERFGGGVIARMIVTGALLERALPPQAPG